MIIVVLFYISYYDIVYNAEVIKNIQNMIETDSQVVKALK
jgi:hypothetical protein